jgi:hypothetical protein
LVSSKKWLLPSLKQVYRVTVEPIIPTIFQRTKATCFAYGQTGRNPFFFFLWMLAIFFPRYVHFFCWYIFFINRPRLSLWINVSMNSEKKKKIPYSTFTCFHLLHICFGFPVVEAMEGGVDSLLISTSKFLFQRCCLFLKSSSVQTLLHSWNPDAAFISGSGKTFTMQPLPLRAAEDLVRLLRQPVYHNQRFKLWLSFFEIYGGKLFDLLSERKLVFPCSNWFITYFFP